MLQLNIAFLWHMHQPLYLDPTRDCFAMPWVRLHAVKSYSDMIACLDSRPEAKVTFNLVPSLLLQIQYYLQGKTDDFMELSRRPAADLSPSDQEFILTHFFSCQWPTMVEPNKRYLQLLELRGRDFGPSFASQVRKKFSTQDYLDLQVWFNLAWIGFSSRNHPLISSLFQKGRLFSEEEKMDLLDFHLELMKGLIPRYSSKWIEGQIEISTSPFYHPILPLLIDTDLGRRPRPETRLPLRFTYPEDARAQLDKGRRYCREILGKTPAGLWPSEGSVAPELIPLIEEAGFSWTATDEAILYNSLEKTEPHSLFQPYKVEISGSRTDMVFRHHKLSDLIGFVYQKNPAQYAINDFVSRLKEICIGLQKMDRSPFVAIILDGENPWEYYRDGGESFLTGLYDAIITEPMLELVTIGQYLENNPPTSTLSGLYTGSWINHDFGIWIGGEEENRAWETLGRARNAIDDAKKRGNITEEALNMAMESVFAAEGSDWFWWYGDKFETDYAYGFDHLFRAHLKKVYKGLNMTVPDELLSPIRTPSPVIPAVEPTCFIHPVIDGHLSYYWEWRGAGSLTLGGQGGAMHSGESSLAEIAYGFDLERLYLRIDPRDKGFDAWDPGLVLRIIVSSKATITIELIPSRSASALNKRFRLLKNGRAFDTNETGVKCAVNEVAEVAIPFALLGSNPKDKLTFFVETEKNELVLDRWPREGYIVLHAPDEDFERRLWLI
ncbi:MAG: alpha-amylase [Deltaproteobacteria bacterium]|nr:alpha-amylase [Deltaproteobacteria bacterium]